MRRMDTRWWRAGRGRINRIYNQISIERGWNCLNLRSGDATVLHLAPLQKIKEANKLDRGGGPQQIESG
jgi:hypothetical protein